MAVFDMMDVGTRGATRLPCLKSLKARHSRYCPSPFDETLVVIPSLSLSEHQHVG